MTGISTIVPTNSICCFRAKICIIVIPLFMLISIECHGQERLLHQIDSMVTRFYYRKTTDPVYIRRPKERWAVKMRANMSGSEIEAHGVVDGVKYDTELESALKKTLSVGATYRGIGVGLSLNPAHITGRDNDMEINLSSYGNKFGGEIVFLSAKTFSGSMAVDGINHVVDKGLVNQIMFSGSGYYVFNHQRFSYPAALNQSYDQLHNAGSWMAALSFWSGNIKVKPDNDTDNPYMSLHTIHFGAGGGYGYNFVVRRNWLFHISALPTFVIYKRSFIEIKNESQHLHYHFPEVIVTARGAVVYKIANYFAGISMVETILNIGSSNKLEMSNGKWRGRIFVGVRL